jgi:REP element-mobilizing transposase RayT
MASTYLSLHYHIVFSTKNRENLIAPAWGSRLHEYLGGTIRGLGGYPQCIGGVRDHVHILAGFNAVHCLAEIMRELKKASSIWVHQEMALKSFAWQEGYAAFTVSAPNREAVRNYIFNQEEHHRIKTFREELLEMLNRSGVEYNIIGLCT